MKRKLGAAVLLVAGLMGVTYSGLRLLSPAEPAGRTVDELPNTPPSYAQCIWNWAYHPLAGTSANFEQAVQAELPEATASVRAFGEDCLYEDGHADFAMMEADFYVRIPAPDATAHEVFGNQISTVMTILLENFPEESLRGGYRGFVQFAFAQSQTDFVIVNVPIERYTAEASGMTGRELFEYFRNPE
jgi:hypothetical protein